MQLRKERTERRDEGGEKREWKVVEVGNGKTEGERES